MKKILLVAGLLMMQATAFAQSGSLTLINHTGCTIYANMLAIESTTGNGASCSLISFPFSVAPGPATYYATPGSFAVMPTGPGFGSETVTIPIAWWIANPIPPQFNWTDIVFQYECDGVGGCNGGGSMTSFYTGISCFFSSPVWTYPTCGHSATWSSTTTLPYNVTIDFY